ncbi:hypothetical protein [Cellulomonas alba]|uniref:Uncharacterized protein n=1 Tax=Cellulomonas alba TaxID=3053467 RepID=A0ABT7SDE2_9CELL|nr:hypothetical protein [Cellulomonas alba]MDM7854212.1 hypothetical protein [Cellulomonas alba]
MTEQDPTAQPPAAPAAPQYAGPPSAPQYGGPPAAPQYGAPPSAPQYVAQAQPVPAPERPATITRAVQLMYVGAALSVVGVVIAWASKSQIRDKVASASTSTTLSASDLDALVNVTLAIATVSALVGVGLWIWMAVKNGAGRPWARIVATVLGGLNVASTLSMLPRSAGASVGLSIVSLALAVVILVLLWRPASSEYYRASEAARRA